MERSLLQRKNENVTNTPRISVAVPLHNEQSVLAELLKRILQVLEALPGEGHEVVFVDDGSVDRTLSILEDAAATDRRITAVSLSRNFGHQAALLAALDHVSGDVVIVMDGDLQDPPEIIPQFLEQYEKGFDVVYAIRTRRKESAVMRLCYATFYRIIHVLADVKLPIGAGDFALMSRRVVDLLRRSHERKLYLRGLRTWVGFRQIGIPVEREARHSGKSKYSIRSLIRLALDGIFAFSVVPLRIATMIGLLAVLPEIALWLPGQLR
jgi:glycosyltransferase involved in cell wall biosynthesis